jgi:hypothetical protein
MEVFDQHDTTRLFFESSGKGLVCESRLAGLYSIRRASSAAYPFKRAERPLWKCMFIGRMQTAGPSAIRDTPPPPAQPFISPVQDT